MSTKFTSGTWHAVKNADDADYVPGFEWHIYSDAYGAVGYWTGGKDRHKDERWYLTDADAHLIAAAPELYDALELALELFEYELVDFGKWGLETDSDIGAKFRAALAKARGEA